MLLNEITIVPPNVVGTLIGRYYAALAKVCKEEVLKKDPKAFYTVTASFDTDITHLLCFFTFESQPKPQPPGMLTIANDLRKEMKLGTFKMRFDKVKEDEHSWSINFLFNLGEYLEGQEDKEHSGDAFDRMSDAAVAAFKANIGDIDHQIHS